MAKAKLQGTRNRSPNHPSINLSRAVRLVRQVHKKNKSFLVPTPVVHELWGYAKGSSTGDQCIAALKSYGLITTAETAEKRQIQVSSRARRIIQEALDADEMVKKAALEPPIHKELWEKYGEDLPSDGVIRHYLLFDREAGCFNEDTVDSFIARFRATLAFAKLESSGIIDEEDGDGDDQNDGGGSSDKPPAGKNVLNPQPNSLALLVPMESGAVATVNVPRMTASSFTFFKKLLDTYETTIVVKPDAETRESEPQQDDE